MFEKDVQIAGRSNGLGDALNFWGKRGRPKELVGSGGCVYRKKFVVASANSVISVGVTSRGAVYP
jgi:hypothetical protein